METGRVFRCLAHGLAAVLLATMAAACHGGAATDSAVRAAQEPAAKAQATGLWDLAALRRVPQATWGEKTGLVQQVYYEGEPFQGKPTRVFACYGRPAEGEGPFPAVLLVHGGGGKAFPDWAEHWAKRGYVALAMDLAGHGPAGRLEDGGPDQDDAVKFRDFTDADAKDMWTYHAVAAVIRGHALLVSRKEVDAKRVALTGISWGGYLTCIIAGLDDRLRAAVPVYGCGFIHENSCWAPSWFAKMSEAARQRWVEAFDPSRYLARVKCPMLFVNGTNDFAYPLDSYQKSYGLVPAPVSLSVTINLKHGHYWTFGEVDAFIDSRLRGDDPLPRLGPMKTADGVASASLSSRVPVAKAELDYTTDTGPWQERAWKTVPAEVKGDRIAVKLPMERPLTCYLRVTDERGLCVSTPHRELADGR